MLARLESALKRERALVSNASHELRTPLSLMKTEIELALAELESAHALAAALRSAAEETDRLAQLTDDVLLLARVDAGELPYPPHRLRGRRAARDDRVPLPTASTGRRPDDRGRLTSRRGRARRPAAAGAGARQPGRELAPPRRRHGTTRSCRAERHTRAPRRRQRHR